MTPFWRHTRSSFTADNPSPVLHVKLYGSLSRTRGDPGEARCHHVPWRRPRARRSRCCTQHHPLNPFRVKHGDTQIWRHAVSLGALLAAHPARIAFGYIPENEVAATTKDILCGSRGAVEAVSPQRPSCRGASGRPRCRRGVAAAVALRALRLSGEPAARSARASSGRIGAHSSAGVPTRRKSNRCRAHRSPTSNSGRHSHAARSFT